MQDNNCKVSYQELRDILNESFFENHISFNLIPNTSPLFTKHQVIGFLPTIKLYIAYSSHGSPSIKNISLTENPILTFDFVNPIIFSNLKLLMNNAKLINNLPDTQSFISPELPLLLEPIQKEARLKAKEAKEAKEKLDEQNKATIEARLLEDKKRQEEKELSKILFNFKCKDLKKLKLESDKIIISGHETQTSPNYLGSPLSEATFETLITYFPDKFKLKGWILIARQHSLSVNGRIDLLFRNISGTKLRVVELELGHISKDHFSKSRIYRRQLSKDLNFPIENIDILLIANGVHETIREECDDLGMIVGVYDSNTLRDMLIDLPLLKNADPKYFISLREDDESGFGLSLSDLRSIGTLSSYGQIMNGKDTKSYFQRQSIFGKRNPR